MSNTVSKVNTLGGSSGGACGFETEMALHDESTDVIWRQPVSISCSERGRTLKTTRTFSTSPTPDKS